MLKDGHKNFKNTAPKQ